MLRAILLVAFLSLGCQSSPTEPGSPRAEPQAPEPAPPEKTPRPAQPPDDQPVTCTTDADCPHLACGPCESGQPILQRYGAVACTRNPCPGSTAVCRDGACVVR